MDADHGSRDGDRLAACLAGTADGRVARLLGLLMTTGDVIRLTSIAAAHQSSEGVILLDVLLDKAGVPDGLDLAWRSKHFLGAPVPGATVATVNLAHIVAAVEFTVAEMAVNPGDSTIGFGDEIRRRTPPSADDRGGGSGGGVGLLWYADPSKAWQLHRRAADVEASDGAQDVDLDALHPAKRQAAIAIQRQAYAGAG